jgi:hypothetical protein
MMSRRAAFRGLDELHRKLQTHRLTSVLQRSDERQKFFMWANKKMPFKRHRGCFIALKNENRANHFVIRIADFMDARAFNGAKFRIWRARFVLPNERSQPRLGILQTRVAHRTSFEPMF